MAVLVLYHGRPAQDIVPMFDADETGAEVVAAIRTPPGKVNKRCG